MSGVLSTTSSMKGEKRRCVRIKRNGEPCGNAPIMGGTVCHKHGGANRAIREAANQRLLAAVEPLMKELLRIALDKKRDDDRKLKAILAALDRAGFGPELIVKELSLQMDVSPWIETMEGIVADDGDLLDRATVTQLEAALVKARARDAQLITGEVLPSHTAEPATPMPDAIDRAAPSRPLRVGELGPLGDRSEYAPRPDTRTASGYGEGYEGRRPHGYSGR